MQRLVLASALALLGCGTATPPRGASTDPRHPQFADPATQAARKGLIDAATSGGIVLEVRAVKNEYHLWVTPAFYRLDYDAKFKLCDLVTRHAHRVPDGQKLQFGEDLLLVDSKTGKSVGFFDHTGLKLD